MKTIKQFAIAILATMTLSCSGQCQQVEIISIQDNVTPNIMSRATFPDAPDSLISDLNLQEGIPASFCAFLVKQQGKEILFDAANGAPDSRLMAVLDSCQVTPEAIDYIFITHLHGDHIGGLLQNGAAAFPHAELYINQREYDGWMAMPKEQTAHLRSIFEAYGDKLKLFDPSDTLPCNIEAIAAYGHTPGHTLYKIGDNIIVGDLMHGVALQLEHPQYCARYDMNKELSIQCRKSIIEMARNKGLKLYGMHFPSPYYLTFD